MPKVACFCVVCGTYIGDYYPSKLKKTCSDECFRTLFSRKYHEKHGVLRICRVCGKTATTEEELDLFVLDPRTKIGRTTLCKECFNKKQNVDYHQRLKETRKEKQREYRHNLRMRVLNHISNGEVKCKVCGFMNTQALQIDHINGGGRAEIKRLGKNTAVYRKILKMSPEEAKKEYQILCANHNRIKMYEKREWGKGNDPFDEKSSFKGY